MCAAGGEGELGAPARMLGAEDGLIQVEEKRSW
jgi:hypothetical protein